jgi:DNA-binding MarR family transcriptional regulator
MSSRESKREPDAWSILAHLWQLTQSVLDESAPALEAIGLSPKAFFLLTTVGDHPFPAQLARLMHLPPPTVTYLVKQMEAKGFLERRAEPGDLRKFRLVLSASGRKAVHQSRQTTGRVLDKRLKRLDPDEISHFDRVVQQLAGN